jgi:PPOX class probable F420-dependent enzyme
MTVLPAGEFGQRAAARLRDERVIWFTTVGADGTPQPNPVWFVWDGAASLLIYNRPDANRLRHIEHRPNVSLNFNHNDRGDDIVVITATAQRDDAVPPPHRKNEYMAKYASAMERVSGSVDAFAAEYPVPVRIDIRRIRGY